jgi:hypothetical protein
MWSLLRGEPDRVIRWAGPLILCGMAVAFLSARLGTPGLLTAFQVIALGAMGGSLAQWRTDRGLWMLSGLFFGVWTASYGLCLYGEIHDISPERKLTLASRSTRVSRCHSIPRCSAFSGALLVKTGDSRCSPSTRETVAPAFAPNASPRSLLAHDHGLC